MFETAEYVMNIVLLVVEVASFTGADAGLPGTVLGMKLKDDEYEPYPKKFSAFTLYV